MNTPVNIAILRDLYDRGMTLEKIGERFGISRQAVQCRFVRAGIERRRGLRRKYGDVEAIRSLLINEGMTLAAVSRLLRISAQTVQEIASQIGIRKTVYRCRKFPALNTIKVGESVNYEIGDCFASRYVRFYLVAGKLGIKLKVRTIDENTVRVTRTQ